MDIFQIIATAAGFVGVASGIPQMIRLVQIKESRDISIMTYLMVLFAQIVWVFYGFHKNDFAIMLTNGFAGAVVIINLFLIFRYRNGKNPN